ncbi:hypothetical protein F5Y18DRAFT_379163 [Xylariaceae sp. FL1019]|nr:hypothetical protein F5Y18DRAFT_379163 [Xylariaceae sp. FL1019]
MEIPCSCVQDEFTSKVAAYAVEAVSTEYPAGTTRNSPAVNINHQAKSQVRILLCCHFQFNLRVLGDSEVTTVLIHRHSFKSRWLPRLVSLNSVAWICAFTDLFSIMGGKKGPAEGSKKAAGQARKANAASAKAAAEDAKKAAAEDKEWQKGAKNNSKKETEAEKKAEAARKKAEKDALLADDERNTPGRAIPRHSRSADDKASATKGLGTVLSQLEHDDKKLPAVQARTIHDSIKLFDLDKPAPVQVDRHPERRHGPFDAYREKRKAEMREEGLKLKLSQREERIRMEWRNHPDNMHSKNYQGSRIKYNSTQEEIQAHLEQQREQTEARLRAD